MMMAMISTAKNSDKNIFMFLAAWQCARVVSQVEAWERKSQEDSNDTKVGGRRRDEEDNKSKLSLSNSCVRLEHRFNRKNKSIRCWDFNLRWSITPMISDHFALDMFVVRMWKEMSHNAMSDMSKVKQNKKANSKFTSKSQSQRRVMKNSQVFAARPHPVHATLGSTVRFQISKFTSFTLTIAERLHFKLSSLNMRKWKVF